MQASGLAFDGWIFRGRWPSGYTSRMDSVRFGRALGVGARAAAKTLLTAADAAASPNPSAKKPTAEASSKPTAPRTPVAVSSAAAAVEQVARTAAQARQVTTGVTQGGRRLGDSVWRPFVKLSGVLWLEFTGVFFGIFAAYAVSGAWKLRAEWRETPANHDMHMHFLMATGMALLFGYFCLSSFMRASRRGSKG